MEIADLLQVVVRFEVLLALQTNVAIIDVLPKRTRVIRPMLPHSLIAALTDTAAIGLAAML